MTRTLDSKKLKEMMNSHKDCPVVFLVDSDVVGDFYGNWYAGGYSCEEGEVLDCDAEEGEERYTYIDREDFREDVEDYVRMYQKCLSDEEFDAEVNRIYKQHEPYWKKAIIVYITT